MSTTVVLHTNTTSSNTGWAVVGAASIEVALADGLTTTYANSTTASGNFREQFTTFTLPALAVVTQVQLTVVWRNAPGQGFIVVVDPLDARDNRPPLVGLSSADAVTWHTTTVTDPFTIPLTQADIDNLSVYVELGNSSVLGPITADIADISLAITYNQAPTVSITAPTGVITSTQKPEVTFTYSDPDGDYGERYQLKVFSATQYGAVDFDPEVSTPAFNSGEVFASLYGITISSVLSNLPNDTYRVYVKASDVGSNGRYGPWAHSDFTLNVPPPPVPIFKTPSYDATNFRSIFSLQGQWNLLSTDDSSLENSQGTWVKTSGGASLVRVAGTLSFVYPDGNYGMSMQVSTGSTGSVQTATGTSANPVVASQAYYVGAAIMRQDCTNITYKVYWYKANGTASTTPSTTITTITTATAVGTFYTYGQVVTSPADAAFASLEVAFSGAVGGSGTNFSADKFVLAPSYLQNLLPVNDASFESSLGTWTLTSGTPIWVRTAVPGAPDGTYVAVWGSSATAGSHSTATGTSGVAVSASTTYYVGASIARVNASAATYKIFWYKSSGAASTTPSTTVATITTATAALNSFIDYSAQVTSPADAAFASLEVAYTSSLSAGTQLQADRFYISSVNAGVMAWTPGGLAQHTFQIQRSDDNGTTWNNIRAFSNPSLHNLNLPLGIGPTENLTAYDYEAPRGITVLYRARSHSEGAGIISISSAWSSVLTITTVRGCTWIKDPADPTRNMEVTLDQHSIMKSRSAAQGVHGTMGRPEPVIVYGTVHLGTFSLALFFPDDATWQQWLVLQDSQRVLLLQSPYGNLVQEQDYFTIDAEVQTETITVDRMAIAQPRRVSLIAREALSP